MIDGLAEKLKNCRKQTKLTQKDVAVRLNISSSIISGYETGERTPSLAVLLKFAGIYRCSVDYLLGIDSNQERISLDISDLSQDSREAVYMFIDTIRRLQNN